MKICKHVFFAYEKYLKEINKFSKQFKKSFKSKKRIEDDSVQQQNVIFKIEFFYFFYYFYF